MNATDRKTIIQLHVQVKYSKRQKKYHANSCECLK